MYMQFYPGNLKGKIDLRELGVEGRIILKLVLEMYYYGFDVIELAQDSRDLSTR
jgi:hypothetical protein